MSGFEQAAPSGVTPSKLLHNPLPSRGHVGEEVTRRSRPKGTIPAPGGLGGGGGFWGWLNRDSRALHSGRVTHQRLWFARPSFSTTPSRALCFPRPRWFIDLLRPVSAVFRWPPSLHSSAVVVGSRDTRRTPVIPEGG